MGNNGCEYAATCPVIINNGPENFVPCVKDCLIDNFNEIFTDYNISKMRKPTIILIGEAPGQSEEEIYIPFVGVSGKLLRDILFKSGLLNYRLVFTNTVKCRPIDVKNNKAFRPPAKEEILYCGEYYLKNTLLNITKDDLHHYLSPKQKSVDRTDIFIILLGNSAVTSIITLYGEESLIRVSDNSIYNIKDKISDVMNFKHKLSINNNGIENNIITYITYHPSYYARGLAPKDEYLDHLSRISASINKLNKEGV